MKSLHGTNRRMTSNTMTEAIKHSKHCHHSSKHTHKDIEVATLELPKHSDPILLFEVSGSKIVEKGNKNQGQL